MAIRQTLLGRFRLDWPLLGKELLEQSARKQMYVVRVTYALLLFGAFCLYYMRHLGSGPLLALGQGYRPFTFLVTMQMLAIFVFLPPLMAGAIAQEKERDTLGLLFLTDLRPWELILQKYVGRLIPMLTLLFLSLPLLAVTYSLGGVSISLLCYSAVTLFLTCLAVGALSLECSAHQATTFQALVRSWGLCLLFVFCCSTAPFQLGLMSPMVFASRPGGYLFVYPLFITTIGSLVPTMLFLQRARQNLEPRAFVQRRNPFGQQFKHLDQYWKDIRKLVRAILRKRDQEAYAVADLVVRNQLGPADDRRRWSLMSFLLAKMQVPYLLAFGIIFGFIVFIILFISAIMDPKSPAFFVIIGALWILALLTLPIQSANAVASERMNERLGAILTTPLTGTEILNEWLAPVRRWRQFLTRPLIVLIVIEAVVKFNAADRADPRWRNAIAYMAISLLTVWIYPRLIQWSCLWIGLRIKNQIRAMLTAFLVVASWCILPLVISNFLVDTNFIPEQAGAVLRFVSPVRVISTAEVLGLVNSDIAFNSGAVTLALAYLALAWMVMWRFRQVSLSKADQYLGRV